MRLELNQSMYGSAVISLHARKNQINENRAKEILSDIAKIWADTAIVDKGVLQANIQLATAKSLNDSLLQQVDYVVMSDILNDKVNQIKNNIQILEEFNGAATITDPVSGLGLADLSESVSDLKKYVIDELMSPIRSLGLTRNRNLSVYYYEDKKKSLGRQLALLENQSALVRLAFTTYNSTQEKALGGSPAPTSVSPYAGVSGPQMSADALEEILSIAGQARSEEYKQKLNNQWLGLNMQAAEVSAKIREANDLIVALKGSGQTELEATLKGEYLSRTETMLPQIIDKLRAYFDVTQRIHMQLGKEMTGANGRLYSPVSSALLIEGVSFDKKRFLMAWIGILILTLVVVVPVAMIRNAMKLRAQVQKQVDAAIHNTLKPQTQEKLNRVANA